jgi:hypothetical protein
MLSGFGFLSGLVVVVGLFYIAYGFGLWETESWGWWIGNDYERIRRFKLF